jgi:hypothetical protein
MGGYPLAYRPTFAAAAQAAQASLSRRAGLADELSIYEVETGIHFEVPGLPRTDDDFPHEALAFLSGIGVQAG